MNNISKCADRKQLDHWLSRKRQADKQVNMLTTDPVTHEKYTVLFRKELEHRIRLKEPNATTFRQYAVYQYVRKEIHTLFDYDTRMMTKTEYEIAIKHIAKLGY